MKMKKTYPREPKPIPDHAVSVTSRRKPVLILRDGGNRLTIRRYDKETAIGYVTGLLGEGGAHGDWNLVPPDNRSGTWLY